MTNLQKSPSLQTCSEYIHKPLAPDILVACLRQLVVPPADGNINRTHAEYSSIQLAPSKLIAALALALSRPPVAILMVCPPDAAIHFLRHHSLWAAQPNNSHSRMSAYPNKKNCPALLKVKPDVAKTPHFFQEPLQKNVSRVLALNVAHGEGNPLKKYELRNTQ